MVIGRITPDDWRQRIEKAMSPDEINEAATWYKKAFAEFRKQSGGDPEEMAKLTDAWFAGQQNSAQVKRSMTCCLFTSKSSEASKRKTYKAKACHLQTDRF